MHKYMNFVTEAIIAAIQVDVGMEQLEEFTMMNVRLPQQFLVMIVVRRVAVKVAKHLLLLTGILRIVLSMTPIAQLFITTKLIQSLQIVVQSGNAEALNTIKFLVLQGVLLLFHLAANTLLNQINFLTNAKLKFYYDSKIMEKAGKIPLEYIESSLYYDQYYRSLSGDKAFQIINLMFVITQNLLSIIFVIIALISFHWSIPFGLLLLVLPNIFISLRTGKLKFQQMYNQTPYLRKQNYLMTVLSGMETAKELRMFQYSNYIIEKWEKVFHKNTGAQYKVNRKVDSILFFNYGLSIFFEYSMYIILIMLCGLGLLSLAEYVALTQAISNVLKLTKEAVANSTIIFENSLNIIEMNKFLCLPEETNLTELFPIPFKTLVIRNLHFQYVTRDDFILKNINFSIQAGEKIAIVGENGSGKTTLIKCIIGLYTPSKGNILVNDKDILNIRKDSLRSNISSIFQDYVHYEMTLKENLSISDIKQINNETLLKEVMYSVGGGDILDSTPNGLNSQLGFMFEKGYELSMGQWQKIALGRLLVKEAEIYILDEPTASLDPVIESEIFEKISELTRNKTTIFISHRLASCRIADRILVLKNGSIAEEGSHDELIHTKGIYYEMFNKQSKWYQ
ncbi:MAG: ABC transporter ATP-binding protein [Paenibacillaceae bacterium]